ncbi:MAG: hypothetical protein ACREE4_03220 [Stellaceae bacterium]
MSSVLNGSFYTAARGGHAPSDLRRAFCAALDAFREWEDGAAEPTIEVRERDLPISEVCGLLWNCSDILPGSSGYTMQLCDDGNLPQRRTYAAAARWLKNCIAEFGSAL